MKLIDLMFNEHPDADRQHSDAYLAAIDAISTCALVCTSCADACLGATNHLEKLRPCIRANLDCAEVCATTVRLLIRQTATSHTLVHSQLQACITACQLCADVCEEHAKDHHHCRLCAKACRNCQAQCNALLGEISSSGVEESVTPAPAQNALP